MFLTRIYMGQFNQKSFFTLKSNIHYQYFGLCPSRNSESFLSLPLRFFILDPKTLSQTALTSFINVAVESRIVFSFVQFPESIFLISNQLDLGSRDRVVGFVEIKTFRIVQQCSWPSQPFCLLAFGKLPNLFVCFSGVRPRFAEWPLLTLSLSTLLGHRH